MEQNNNNDSKPHDSRHATGVPLVPSRWRAFFFQSSGARDGWRADRTDAGTAPAAATAVLVRFDEPDDQKKKAPTHPPRDARPLGQQPPPPRDGERRERVKVQDRQVVVVASPRWCGGRPFRETNGPSPPTRVAAGGNRHRLFFFSAAT